MVQFVGRIEILKLDSCVGGQDSNLHHPRTRQFQPFRRPVYCNFIGRRIDIMQTGRRLALKEQ
jgi:hypothetical protein